MLAIECMSHTSLQNTGRTFSLVTIEFQFPGGILPSPGECTNNILEDQAGTMGYLLYFTFCELQPKFNLLHEKKKTLHSLERSFQLNCCYRPYRGCVAGSKGTACIPSSWEAGQGGCKFETSLGYILRPCQKQGGREEMRIIRSKETLFPKFWLVRQKPTSSQELMELVPACQKVILFSTKRDIRLFHQHVPALPTYQHIEVHAGLQTPSVPTHNAPLQSSHSSLRLPSSQIPVPLEPWRLPSVLSQDDLDSL